VSFIDNPHICIFRKSVIVYFIVRECCLYKAMVYITIKVFSLCQHEITIQPNSKNSKKTIIFKVIPSDII